MKQAIFILSILILSVTFVSAMPIIMPEDPPICDYCGGGYEPGTNQTNITIPVNTFIQTGSSYNWHLSPKNYDLAIINIKDYNGIYTVTIVNNGNSKSPRTILNVFSNNKDNEFTLIELNPGQSIDIPVYLKSPIHGLIFFEVNPENKWGEINNKDNMVEI